MEIKKHGRKGVLNEEMIDMVTGGDLSGGELNDRDMAALDRFIALYKAQGRDLEVLLSDMRKYNYSNEALSYVSTHW